MMHTPICLKEKLGKFDELWSPRVIAELNDYQFKLAKIRGDFVWHSHEDTDEAFVVLDDHLAEQELRDCPWVAGPEPTVADIACFPYVALSNDGGIARDEYPAIERWLARVMALPGFIDMPGILTPWSGEATEEPAA